MLDDEQIMHFDCKECDQSYYISVQKNCCPKCFFSKIKKQIDKEINSKWKNRKKFACSALLTMVPLLLTGSIFGGEAQLLVTVFFIYGLLYTHLINWILGKF